MNEELLSEIKGMLPYVIVAALAVGGYYGIKNYREARATASSAALVKSVTAEELEESATKFSGAKSGGAIKIKLAKKYFDAGRYDEALAIYDELAKKAPAGFEEIPVLGRAQCLEASGKSAEALKAYADFSASAATNSPFALSAKLGAARCVALGGDKAKALADLAALKDSFKDDPISKARVEAAEDCVKRYEK